ncbi:MAG: HAD family hydrolase [Candidatus Lokiarchaeota archaeon]|nr:HAD family hydrolase [Candidatus Lokiarchaeota archaeon]
MSHQPIVLFDFDGIIITQKALEYTASIFLKNSFYNWKNIEKLRLIDLARMFEEADSKNRIKALLGIIKVYKQYIPRLWKRILFFMKFRRAYPKYEKYETLKPDLEEILTKFKEHNFILGIVSNTSKIRLNHFGEKFNLTKYFSVFISRDDTPYRKPSAFPIFAALNIIKKKFDISIENNNVYYVGDLPHDIQCAKNAKVASIALLSGHGTKEGLENSDPSFIIKDLKDLLEINSFKKFLLD